MSKFRVQQTFESFGGPHQVMCESRRAADHMADQMAREIAAAFYQRAGGSGVTGGVAEEKINAVIPPYSRDGKTGWTKEIAFHALLSEDSGADVGTGATGRMPWPELVQRIRAHAISIEEVTDEN